MHSGAAMHSGDVDGSGEMGQEIGRSVTSSNGRSTSQLSGTRAGDSYRDRLVTQPDETADSSGANASVTDPPTRSRNDLVIQLDAAVCLLGSFPALAGADLQVEAGEIVLLEGPNGAGKSTLLRLCAGLAALQQGTGHILGHDLRLRSGRQRVRRSVGLLGHHSALYDELTVEENLRFWARANRVPDTDIEPALERLELAGRLRSVRVAALSAGQRRRTSLAVVVCRRPRLWLLDEPHAGLDARGRDLVDGLVRDACAAGATVLFSSHERERASELAHRVVDVIGGRTRDRVS